MQPSPIAETCGPLLPSCRRGMSHVITSSCLRCPEIYGRSAIESGFDGPATAKRDPSTRDSRAPDPRAALDPAVARTAKRREVDYRPMRLHHRRFPAAQQDRAHAVSQVRGAAADSRLSLPSAAGGRRRAIGGSRTCSRSGSRAITTSGAPCGPTASPSATAPAMPTPYDKFLAWAATVPQCLRNPLYHWTHLELRRYFGIDELLDEKSAPAIWERGQRTAPVRRAHRARHPEASSTCVPSAPPTIRPIRSTITPRLPRRGCRRRSIRRSGRIARCRWTIRDVFNPWVDRLGRDGGRRHRHASRISSDALRQRHQDFHDAGGRLSDHGLPHCYAADVHRRRGGGDLRRARAGQAAEPGRARAVRVVPDAAVRPARRGEGLDQAAPPRRAAQHQHAHAAHARPRHRLRLDRRLSAGRRRWRGISIAWSRRTRCRRRSSTTTTRTTTTRWRR